jgi:hypothetical protein
MVSLCEKMMLNVAIERMPTTVQIYRSGLVFCEHCLTLDIGVEATVFKEGRGWRIQEVEFES